MSNVNYTIAQKSNASFHFIVFGQIISIMGSTLLRFALSLYVLDLTGRADLFATLYAVSSLPMLLAPIGGAIADRFNRRNLIVLCDITNSVVVLISVALLSVNKFSVPLIGMVMVMLATISAMYTPTVSSCVPLLVEESKLEGANGIVQGVQALSGIVSPLLGALLYGIIGIKTLIIISGVAFILSAFMESFVKIPYHKRKQSGHIIPTIAKDMKEGFIYIVKQPFILKCMIFAAILNLFLSPFFIVGVPVILRVTMNSTDTMYGIGVSITEFGMILGAMTAGLFAKNMRVSTLSRWLVGIALLIMPLAISLLPSMLNLGYYPSFILFFLFTVPILMILTSISIYIITHVQRETPNDLLGKVMAIIMAVAQCVAPIGQIIYGLLFETFSLMVFIPTIILSIITLLLALTAKILFKNE